MAVLDDVCASQHGVREGADANLKSKLRDNCRTNKHFQEIAEGFAIHHYAGEREEDVLARHWRGPPPSMVTIFVIIIITTINTVVIIFIIIIITIKIDMLIMLCSTFSPSLLSPLLLLWS